MVASGGVAAHPDNAYRLLHDEEQLVLVFPEGTKATGKLYTDRYRLRRFGRGGFVEIAMRAGAPVVPIAVMGAEEAMPILFKSSRLAKVLNLPYFPVTANMLAFGPAGLVAYLPAKFRSACCRPCTSTGAEPGAVLAQPRDGGVGAHPADGAGRAYDMLRKRRSVWFG